ncbi:MAG: RNA methyltransferase [Kiritimatiellae bacterium]|nr:RNA methyltransferase [Kiritimatiellia bacterium]
MNPLNNIRIVLVGTLYSGNVGSVCRAMANMGLRHLTLVAPRILDDWSDGPRMAVHAVDLLEARKEVATLEEAVADCVAVVGTTARGGLYRATVQTPRVIVPELLRLATQGPVAIVFGREDQGLHNDEIALCTHLIRIPVDEHYQSLNLSQALLIVAYELYTATGTYVSPVEEADALADQSMKNALMMKWRKAMLDIGFMEEPKADHMMQGFRRIFSRGVKTVPDARIMLGAAHQMSWAGETARKNEVGESSE